MTASPAPSQQGVDPFADRRAHARVAVAMPAFLQAHGNRHAVQILDLSAGGAKLDCPVSLATGTAVVLDCGTLSRVAQVRWQNGALLGLCFDSELEDREVRALLARANALAARLNIAD